MQSSSAAGFVEHPAIPTQVTDAGRYSQVAWWVTFLPIVVVHALFIFSFPLNDRGGDTPNYFTMLVKGDSSLVHPSGYPFLIGLPFRHGPMSALIHDDDPAMKADLERGLLITQHGISIVGMVALFVLVRRIYGSAAASVATLILGLNVNFMGATSATYPEWLQATLLILAGWAAGSAYFHPDGRRKLLWYALSVVLFSWCFLTKFNASVLAALYALPLAAERRPWRSKLIWSGAMALLAVSTVLAYEVLVQEPRTGTRRLTADTSWVLLTRIETVYGNKLAASNGLATKRWLALAAVIPMHYEVAGAELFRRVDAIPSAVRAPYRPVFDRFANANEAFLDDWLRSHPVPNGFTVGVSPIPICYFVGLFEANDLGVKVAIEAVRAAPITFAKSVWREFLAAAGRFPQSDLSPTVGNMQAYRYRVSMQLPHRWVLLNQPPRPAYVPYSYRVPAVWWPGVKLFDWLNTFPGFELFTRLSVAIATVIAIVSVVARRRINVEAGVVLVVSGTLAIFILASCITLAFRWKEFCLAVPLISLLAGAGAGWAPRELVALVRDFKRA